VVVGTDIFRRAAEPLKVGFLTVNTGPLAAGGKQQIEAAPSSSTTRRHDRGRKIELITQDTAAIPPWPDQDPGAGRTLQGAGDDRPAGDNERWRSTTMCATPRCAHTTTSRRPSIEGPR